MSGISGIGSASGGYHLEDSASMKIGQELTTLQKNILPQWQNINANNRPSGNLITLTEGVLSSIKTTLTQYSQELIQDAKNNNWPSPPDNDAIQNFINSANNVIDGFNSASPEQLAESGDAVIVSLNEFLTQVHYRATTMHP